MSEIDTNFLSSRSSVEIVIPIPTSASAKPFMASTYTAALKAFDVWKARLEGPKDGPTSVILELSQPEDLDVALNCFPDATHRINERTSDRHLAVFHAGDYLPVEVVKAGVIRLGAKSVKTIPFSRQTPARPRRGQLYLAAFGSEESLAAAIAEGFVIIRRERVTCRRFRTDGETAMVTDRPTLSVAFLNGFPVQIRAADVHVKARNLGAADWAIVYPKTRGGRCALRLAFPSEESRDAAMKKVFTFDESYRLTWSLSPCCLYCGRDDHLESNCPNAAPRPAPRPGPVVSSTMSFAAAAGTGDARPTATPPLTDTKALIDAAVAAALAAKDSELAVVKAELAQAHQAIKELTKTVKRMQAAIGGGMGKPNTVVLTAMEEITDDDEEMASATSDSESTTSEVIVRPSKSPRSADQPTGH